MWLEAFHLLMNVKYAYTFARLRCANFSDATDSFVIAIRDMEFRYLTMWNLVSEGLHIAMWNMVRATVWNMKSASIARRGTW
jgi:hypothetical protein